MDATAAGAGAELVGVESESDNRPTKKHTHAVANTMSATLRAEYGVAVAGEGDSVSSPLTGRTVSIPVAPPLALKHHKFDERYRARE